MSKDSCLGTCNSEQDIFKLHSFHSVSTSWVFSTVVYELKGSRGEIGELENQARIPASAATIPVGQ